LYVLGRLSVVDIAEVNPKIGTDHDVETTVKNTIEFITRCFRPLTYDLENQ
jgi:anti-sigma-K factor RskA